MEWVSPLSMQTPAATAFDLGCAFALEVAPDGTGSVRVTSVWVQLEAQDLQTLVPAGAQAETRQVFSPRSPYFEDATPEFKHALQMLNFETLDSRAYKAALQAVLVQARTRDVLSLLNLFFRSSQEERGVIYDRAAPTCSCGSRKCHRRREGLESATSMSRFAKWVFTKNKTVTLLHELWRTLEGPDGVFVRHRSTRFMIFWRVGKLPEDKDW
jgi:hypothetical protein